MNQPAGGPRTPVDTGRFDDFPIFMGPERDIEQPRTNAAPASPLWTATPLRASSAAPSPTPTPSASEHSGSAMGYIPPSPLHFQATVESAPPTPSTGPVGSGQDEPAVITLEEELQADHREEDPAGGSGGGAKEEGSGGGGMGEPPALVYVQPSPGQLESGVPVSGWLCDPEWLRRRLREFTLGDAQGGA